MLKVIVIFISCSIFWPIFAENIKGDNYFITTHQKDLEKKFEINSFRFIHMIDRAFRAFKLSGYISEKELPALLKNLYEDLKQNYQKRVVIKNFKDKKSLILLFKFLKREGGGKFDFFIISNFDLKSKTLQSPKDSCNNCWAAFYLYNDKLLTNYKYESNKTSQKKRQKNKPSDLNDQANDYLLDEITSNDILIENNLKKALNLSNTHVDKGIILATYVEFYLYQNQLILATRKFKEIKELERKASQKEKKTFSAIINYVNIMIELYTALNTEKI